MKKFGFLVAAAALLAFATSPAGACDHAAKSEGKDGKQMGCPMGKASKPAGKDKLGCAGHAGAADKDSKKECVGHADAGGKGKACCAAHAGAGVKGEHKCTASAEAKKTEVSLTGKVLCEHCDLHKKDSCNPVFQAAGSTETVAFCGGTDVEAVKKAGDHGKAVLDVKGFLCETPKGEKLLMVSSFTAKS